jgi:hypothetical protein
MPDDKSDSENERDNVLAFSLERKAKKDGQKPKGNLKIDLEETITTGAVLVALIVAVAMASGWIPINIYALGIFAVFGAGAAIAMVVRAQRTRASPTKRSPRRK